MPLSQATVALFNEARVVPLADVVRSAADLPLVAVDQITFPEESLLLDNIGVGELATTEHAEFTTVSVALLFAAEVAFEIPGLDGMALVVGGNAAGGTEVVLEADLGPDHFAFRIIGSLSLRFARSMLKPVTRVSGDWVELVDRHSELRIEGMLRVDGDGDVSIETSGGFDLTPSMVADSGVVIEAQNVIPILSRKMALPPGAPPEVVAGWRGIFIEHATLHLPAAIDVPIEALTCENCHIGNGGFTGSVSTSWATDPPAGHLFGLAFSLTKVQVGFRQNIVTECAIGGTVDIPFFDQPVDVDVGLRADGGFGVKLASDSGLSTLTKPGILRLELTGLGFEEQNDELLVKLGGTIALLYGAIDWPEVEVRELSIDQHGHVRIEGGWLDLPESKVLDFNGFTMELSRIGFGNMGERRWIGFSGAIRLVDELAFGASVEGLKVLWDAAGNVDLQISSIRVNLVVKDVLAFDGHVDYFQEGDTKGFRGDIALRLDSLDTSFDASLIVGRNQASPAFNFFYIFVNADLPAGIPLGQTNLAIYGFSALMGHNVAPTRTPEQEWFQWYLAPPIGTTATQKWGDMRGTQALGAGLTIGTASDDGFAFAAKAILVILMPGPLLLVDGKANMLKKRSELAGQGQGDYRALAVLDRRAGTFLINVQPRFKYDPAKGAMLDVIGVAEGFFDFNRPDAWHLYLGEDEPPEKRIRARIFKGLLNADSYLMLDDPGMRFGASVGFDEDHKYGPLRVALKARIEGEAQVSWRPMQADGTLTLEGQAALRAFGCKSSASVNARLEVQTPQPYHVHGSFRVKLRTPWPLRDPSARVRLEWGDPDEDPPHEETVARVAAEHLKASEAWDLAHSAQRWKTHEVPGDLPVIPLDAKLLLNFSRPVADRALVACNAAPSPAREKVGRREVLHELTGLKLSRAHSHAGWTVVEERTEAEGELYGMWLPLPGNAKAAGKLQLWSASPFACGRNCGRSYFDWFLEQHPGYPCFPEEPAEAICVDFDQVPARLFPALFVVGDFIFELLFPAKEMQPKLVTFESGWTGTHRALLFGDPAGESVQGRVPLRITLPEPAADVRLFLNADRPISLRAFRDAQAIDSASSATTGDVEIGVKGNGIEYVELALTGPQSRGQLRLLRVCSTAQSDRDRAEEVERVRAQLALEMRHETARWCGEGHLLEPDSLYELEIGTRIRAWRDGDEEAALPKLEYVYFRTSAGPPGFFATPGLLRDLTPYVSAASTTPENGAHPIYRAYDLRLAFNENYVERLYDGNGHGLAIALLDRNGRPATDERGVPVAVASRWTGNPHAQPAVSDALWRWALQREELASTGCAAPGDLAACIEPNDALEASLPDRPLAPQALIEASVRAAGRDEALYRIAFTTSRFATFTHHVHSFSDAAWDHHRLLGQPMEPLLDGEALSRMGEIVTSLQAAAIDDLAAEAPLFDEASRLFALAHRPLPERMEVTVLGDATRGYALLLESPEPIEWARTTLALRAAAPMPFTNAATGPVKIVDAALAGPDGEWVELLVQSTTDIGGFAIEYAGASIDPTSFSTYYEFPDEGQMPPGTIVRVHGGSQTAVPASAAYRVHRYANSPQLERLNPAGEALRLVDPSGRPIHRRHHAAASAFQERDFVPLRNADGTRALIFLPESDSIPVGHMPEGVVRMEWRFQLDMGPAAPLLTRGGSSEPESAAIEFALPAIWP